jgi:serine/threonine-protein kinase RsbW
MPMPATPTHIAICNDRAEIERIHAFLDEYYHRYQVPTNVHFVIMLALDELITNIISYAYADARQHLIDIYLISDTDRITVEIADDGLPFNPLEVNEPDLDVPIEERQIGGLGIHLVRKLMDSVRYTRSEGRNVFTFVKSYAGNSSLH